MIISNLADISLRQFDVCVIGAGAAGIITALELSRANASLQVLLLDFGPLQGWASSKNQLDQSIKIDNLVNHHPPDECTNKGLGGTTATWGGRCVMYDEVDFIPRDILRGHCTWEPGLLEEIQADVPKTQQYFESGTGAFQLPNSTPPIAESFESECVTDKTLERWSMPTRFGCRYRAEIMRMPNLHLICDIEARRFIRMESGNCVDALVVRNRDSNAEATAKARVFIIANGAQEATRLLLRNPALFESLGGVPDSLGKYYQGHVSGKIASVKFWGDSKKTDYGFIREPDGTFVRRRFQMTTECIIRQNLLNTAFWLDNPLYFDPSHRSGAMSFMYLAMITPILGRKLAPPALVHSVTKGKATKIGSHILNILRGLPGSLIIPAKTFWKRYCVKRKLPGVFLYSSANEYALHFHSEQIPVPQNRMELADDGETLLIHYELTNEDIQSVIASHKLLDSELRRSNCGELRYWFDEEVLPERIVDMSRDGVHQCGTTRIAKSAEDGVVDRDLKLFGTDNVFVCSSSTFPTSGQANPTFLLGVFAVRLARHLRDKILATS